MPMAELNQWAEFHAIEPFGPYFDDLRAATVAAAIYNVHRDHKTHPELIDPSALAPWNALHRKHCAPAKPKMYDSAKDHEAAIVAMVAKVSTAQNESQS